MLSTIVFCEGRTSADMALLLVRTLACLVPLKVDGVLCDVRIAGPAAAGLGLIANHAGCELVESDDETDRLRLALEAARGQNIFLLLSARAPEAGFIEEVNDFLGRSANAPLRVAGLRASPERFLERLFPSLTKIAGLIAARDLLLREACSGFQDLVRSVGATTILHTRARRIC